VELERGCTVQVSVFSISITDDLGNQYELDPFAMDHARVAGHGPGRRKGKSGLRSPDVDYSERGNHDTHSQRHVWNTGHREHIDCLVINPDRGVVWPIDPGIRPCIAWDAIAGQSLRGTATVIE
jgi:hypothetical protein